MKKILLIFGTRPEAIKMAPLVVKLRKHNNVEVRVCVTGQHREMLDQVLDLFQINPDYDFSLMKPGQDLDSIIVGVITGLKSVFSQWIPDFVLVHGDTSTTFAASLSAYHHRIPIGHVEAGLRTGNIYSPWPEEGNRRLTSVISQLHFAPTDEAKKNLLDENTPLDSIYVTGNTVIDALFYVKQKISENISLQQLLNDKFNFLNHAKRLILVTGHRRENFGSGFERICDALMRIAIDNNDVELVYPVHPNPVVQELVFRRLSKQDNIHLVKPLDYLSFVYLMDRSTLILTDSGGIQEEAPSLGKPVLVMREATERPEAVSAGTVKLVGTNVNLISQEAGFLLNDQNAYRAMAIAHNPYGDGKACERIVSVLIEKIEA